MQASGTIDSIEKLFERSGLSCSVRPIDEDFMQALFGAEDKKAGNPEFDPSLHKFGAENSFWLACRNQADDIIATVAARLFEADSFLETCRSYHLWYGDKIRVTEPLDIVFDQYDRVPAGKAAFVGAGWVRPQYRGYGISWAMTRLANYIALNRWQPDWLVGMVIPGIARANVPTVNFGFTRGDLFANGFRVPGFSRQNLFLLTMTAQEASTAQAGDWRFLKDQPHLALDSEFGAKLRARRHRVEDIAIPEPAIRVAS